MFNLNRRQVNRLKVATFGLLICSGVFIWSSNTIPEHEQRDGKKLLDKPENQIATVPKDVERLDQSPASTTMRNVKTKEAKNGAKISIYNIDTPSKDNHTCVQTRKIEPRFHICVHPLKQDVYVSHHIIKYGIWELQQLQFLKKCLLKDPEYGVIDLGANIGLYALTAASMGRPVVAVEARYLHVEMIHHSVLLNGFQNQSFTLLHNAISDNHDELHLHLFDRNNQGQTEVTSKKSHMGIPSAEISTVRAILMDDLLEVVPFKKAIIKIDIEGSEYRAIKHCEKLLQRIYVPYIFMEWFIAQQMLHESAYIKASLLRNGYTPYSIAYEPLDLSKEDLWPRDIIWEHESVKSS